MGRTFQDEPSTNESRTSTFGARITDFQIFNAVHTGAISKGREGRKSELTILLKYQWITRNVRYVNDGG